MTGSKKNLGALLSTAVAAAEPAAAASAAPPLAAGREPAKPAASPEPRSSGFWQDFERKDTRIRQDQLEWLESTRKSLNRAKGSGVGERLTDNTLVRVALDLLRSRSEALAGTTEAELRASVGLSESS